MPPDLQAHACTLSSPPAASNDLYTPRLVPCICLLTQPCVLLAGACGSRCTLLAQHLPWPDVAAATRAALQRLAAERLISWGSCEQQQQQQQALVRALPSPAPGPAQQHQKRQQLLSGGVGGKAGARLGEDAGGKASAGAGWVATPYGRAVYDSSLPCHAGQEMYGRWACTLVCLVTRARSRLGCARSLVRACEQTFRACVHVHALRVCVCCI